jgi:hypothetical protein
MANIGRAGPRTIDDDLLIRQAINEIASTYGYRVSVERKKKSLHKFGRTNLASTAKTTVAVFQDAITNETFATTNSITHVVSTSADDDGPALFEGHYFDDNGDLKFVSQTRDLTGQTPAPFTQAMCRTNRIANAGSEFFRGSVVAFDPTLSGGGVSSGKPDVDESVKVMCQGGATELLSRNRSEKCATSISVDDFYIITTIAAGLTKNTGADVAADVEVEYRPLNGVWRPFGFELNIAEVGDQYVPMPEIKPYFIAPNNCDMRMVGTATTTSVTIAGFFHGYLAKVIGTV